MPTPLTLEQLQPFIDFVNATLPTKPYTTEGVGTWTAGRPLVATGVGYGVQLGSFPPSGVTSVNGLTGDVEITKASVGLGNVPNVDCTNASNILTGTLPLSVIPAAALERLVHVADETERFALTTASVQNGDIVQQDDTGIMYKVVDDANLDSASGYNEFVAGIAAAVNWSGVLNVPQNLVDISLADAVEKGMLVYLSGQWITRSPAEVRSNLDIPVKGGWDMSPVPLLAYPVDQDATALAPLLGEASFATFPAGDGETHVLTIAETLANTSYGATTQDLLDAVFVGTTDTGDLKIPTSGTAAILFSWTLPDPLPVDAGVDYQVLLVGKVAGGPSITALNVTLSLSNTGSSYVFASFTSDLGTPQTGVVFITPFAVVAGSTHRAVLYVEGSSRTMGLVVDGVDLGRIQTAGLVDCVLPAGLTGLSMLKLGKLAAGFTALDPAIGEQILLTHSVDPVDISETVPGTLIPWAAGDATMPVGAEVSNRYEVVQGGTFAGMTAETGDIVEILNLVPPGIFVYPGASSVVRQAQLSDYATLLDLGNLQSQVDGQGTQIGDLQTDVSDIQAALLTVDNRTAREKFIAKGFPIVGFSTSGVDLDAVGVEVDDVGVIVSSFDSTGTFVGITGDFAGMPAGSVAFKVEGVWTHFVPLPGDEYRYEVGVPVAALGGDLPLVLKATYLGRSPAHTDGSRYEAPVLTSPEFQEGVADRPEALREVQPSTPYGFFSMLGWRLDEPLLGRNTAKVRHIYASNPNLPIVIDPLSDENVLVILDSSAFDPNRTLTLMVQAPLSSDTPGTVDADYEHLPVGATKEGRIRVFPLPAFSEFTVEARFRKGTSGMQTVAGRYRFMPSSVGTAVPGSRHLDLDYRLVPQAIGVGSGAEAWLEVTRKDSNASVAYSTPTTIFSSADMDAQVLHLDGGGDSQYDSYADAVVRFMRLPLPLVEGQRLVVKVASGYVNTSSSPVVWTTSSNPPEGIHVDTLAALPDRMRDGESLEFVACREPYQVSGTTVTVGDGPLVWSLLPGMRSGLPSHENVSLAVTSGTVSQVLAFDTTHISVSSTAGGTIRVFPGAQLAVEEGDTAVCRISSALASGLVAGIQVRASAGGVVDLPGSILRPLSSPFDVRLTWQRIDGSLLLISSEIVQETKPCQVVDSTASATTTVAGTAVLSFADGPGEKTGAFTAGKFAQASHRITIHARSGVSRCLSTEILVRFTYDGTDYVKVAETVLFEDLVNVPSGEMTVTVPGTPNDNSLRIEVQSTVAETIDWSASIHSVYS